MGNAMRQIGLLCLALIISPVVDAAAPRPNVLLIVADDLGYTDVGVFGSDIRTPNIDALARRGQTFTQFHTASSCAPTRAMLLSGNNNHVAGIGNQGIRPGRVTDGLSGYEGQLSARVGVLPVLLAAAGYRTYMAGKWHLGYEAHQGPAHHGFEKSFNLNGGAASHFDETGIEANGPEYYENGQRVSYPTGRYTTAVYTDKLIQYLTEHGDDARPFFAYAAYTSPHWPLQVPDEDLDLYAGQFDEGYDAYRGERFAALKEAGVVSRQAALPPRNPDVTPWAFLSPEQQRRESRKMELYAAMVENLDRHIGRLLAHIARLGKERDTLVIFMSDNGPDGGDFYRDPVPYREYVRANYTIAYEQMGRPGSFITTGAGWAEASSAPYRLFKRYTTEGGTTAPLIAAGASVARASDFKRAYVTVSDIAPTLLELAGAEYPADKVPMSGRSLVPVLQGRADRVHGDDSVTVYFFRNRASLRVGDWKLMNVETPFDESRFGLYDLKRDPAETTDVSALYPEKRAELIGIWRAARRAAGIVLPGDL
jgi:arylsulfatase